jgi:hypothetical protein
MKKAIFLYVLFLISMFLFGEVYSYQEKSNTDSVKLTLTSNKNLYLESELIWIELDIVIDKNLKLDYRPLLYPGNDLNLSLINSKKDTIKYRGGHVDALIRKDYPDSMYYIDNLLWTLGSSEKLQTQAGYSEIFKVIPPDDYTLNITVQLRSNNKSLYCQSNSIKFSIIKPSEFEIEAYNELINLESYTVNNQYKLGYEFIKMMESFNEKYPGSVYKEKIFNNSYFLIGCTLPHEETEIFYNNFINDNPNYYSIFNLLWGNQNKYENKTEYINYLQKMSVEKEGLLISKLCKIVINMILHY